MSCDPGATPSSCTVSEAHFCFSTPAETSLSLDFHAPQTSSIASQNLQCLDRDSQTHQAPPVPENMKNHAYIEHLNAAKSCDKQEHSENTDVRQGESRPDPESVSGWLPKFNGDLPCSNYICGKIFMKIRSVCPEIWAKLCKNALYRNVEESDDFQNLLILQCSKTQLW